jgi:hypothetical protein
MKELRLELLRGGVSPTVYLGDGHSIRTMTLPELKKGQQVKIVAAPAEAAFLQRFATELGDEPYCCETVAAYMQRAVCAMLRRRERPARVAEAAVRRRGECEHCGAEGAEVHHKAPVSAGGASALDNLQLLCRDCHLA